MKSLVILLLIALAFAELKHDLVTAQLPSCGKLQKMYSGYLNIGGGKEHHYIYVEAAEEPENKPLLFWFNGGPGCSSMIGFIQEHGPCVFLDDADTSPQKNPHAWTNFASIVYMESPSGVGYNNNKKDFEWDDETSADDNLESVLEFFQGFPELMERDLYLSGESYAGIYVPYLAKRILDHNQDLDADKQVNLKGIIIGNAVTNWKYDTTPALIEMAWSHSLIPNDVKTALAAHPECEFNEFSETENPKICEELEAKVWNNMKNLNPYDIYRNPEEFYSK